MNVRERVEGEDKKNNDSLSILFYTVNLSSVCQGNTDRKRKEKEERNKEKNTDRAQTKLNSPHVRYNGKILPQ